MSTPTFQDIPWYAFQHWIELKTKEWYDIVSTNPERSLNRHKNVWLLKDRKHQKYFVIVPDMIFFKYIEHPEVPPTKVFYDSCLTPLDLKRFLQTGPEDFYYTVTMA